MIQYLKKIKKLMIVCLMLSIINIVALGASLMPAAATPIKNQATMEYTRTDSTSSTVVTNEVTLNILPVYSVIVSKGEDYSTLPGEKATFRHTITNMGNVADTYSLTTGYPIGYGVSIYLDANNDGTADSITPITVTPSINPGEKTYVVLILDKTNSSALIPSEEVGYLKATSVGDNSIDATGSEKILYRSASVKVKKSYVTGYSSTTVSNTGTPITDLTVTVRIEISNPVNIQATTFKLVDNLFSQKYNYIDGSARWKKFNSPDIINLTDSGSNNPAENSAGISYEYDGLKTVNFTIASVPGSIAENGTDIGILEFQVKIPAGTATDLPNGTTNQITYNFQDNGGNKTTGTAEAKYTVLQYGQLEYTAPAPIVSALTGSSDTVFNNVLKNTGNGTDTFNLSFVDTVTPGANFPAATQFKIEKASDNTDLSSGFKTLSQLKALTPPTITLAANATETIKVTVKIPQTDPAFTGDDPWGPYSLTKVATSTLAGYETVSASAVDTITAIYATDGISITGFFNGNIYNKGGKISYIHPIENTGNYPVEDEENFRLKIENGSGVAWSNSGGTWTSSSASGWTIEIYLSNNPDGSGAVLFKGDGTDDIILAVGGKKYAVLNITSPISGAQNGSSITTKLVGTIIPDGNHGHGDISSIALDTTTIIADQINFNKYLSLDVGSANYLQSSNWKSGSQNANPGDTVYYLIEAKNTASSAITTIKIYDTLSQYLQYVTTPFDAQCYIGDDRTTTQKCSATPTYTDGTRKVEVTVDNLGAGKSVYMYFAAKVIDTRAKNHIVNEGVTTP